MKGVGQNLITASMIEGFYSLTGHNANTGEPCSLLSNKDCLRSALMILKNPGPFPLQLKNAGFNVDWTTPSKYKVSLKLVDVISESYDCPMVCQLRVVFILSGWSICHRGRVCGSRSRAHVDCLTWPGSRKIGIHVHHSRDVHVSGQGPQECRLHHSSWQHVDVISHCWHISVGPKCPGQRERYHRCLWQSHSRVRKGSEYFFCFGRGAMRVFCALHRSIKLTSLQSPLTCPTGIVTDFC